jgi:hypothetical protein
MIGSGTIRIVAHINGKCYELTHHLGVSDAFVKLTPPQASVFPFAAPTLDSTRFTASMSDGSVVNIVYPRWVFTADVGAGTTSFNCAFPIRNPCAVAVRDNGSMSVTVSYKGVEKHARTRVTLRNRFELSANPGTVARGNYVTFTATLNGQPAAAARWRWKPDTVTYDSIAGCGAVSKCHREIIDSGEMWAYSSSSGGDSASARVALYSECASLRKTATLGARGSTANRSSSQAASADLSCSEGGGEGSAEADSAPTLNLTIQADTGLLAEPGSGVYALPTESVVHYSFSAPLGATMRVSIDGGAWTAPVTSVNSVVRMNTAHTVTAALFYDCSGTSQQNGKDSLRLQYLSRSRDTITTVPACADFLYRPTLSFGDYNIVRDHSDPPDTTNYAILASIVWLKVRDLHDSNSFTIDTSNRVYSTPNHQLEVGKGKAPNSRHIYGAAADLYNAPANDSVYWAGQKALVRSKSPAPCVEPYRLFKGTHRHVDWSMWPESWIRKTGVGVVRLIGSKLSRRSFLMKRIVVLAGLIFCMLTNASSVAAQASQSASGADSDPVWDRVKAFNAMKKASPTFAGAGDRNALLTFLEQENALLVASERPGEKSVGERYGEGYGEYYSALLNACAKFCPRSQPAVVRALVSGAYNADSPFALDLVRHHGPVVVAIMTENVTRSDFNRGEYLEMLALAARESRALTPQARAGIRQTALTFAGAPDVGSRVSAAAILAEVGVSSDQAVLDRLASQDAYHYRSGGRDVYPVRDAAQKALPRARARKEP